MSSPRHGIPTLLALLFATATALARPAPVIPMEAVPEDMPPEVRKLVLRLYGPDDSDCMQAVAALKSMGPAAAPAAPFLAGILHDEVRHGATAWLAVDALISIGKPSIEPILIMFQFGGAHARMRGLKVLRALKDERGIPALISMIADSMGASGHSAYDVLRDYGQPAHDYIVQGLKSDNPTTRRNSVYALPSFPTANTIELLSAAMSDQDLMVRTAAREALVTVTKRDPTLAFPPNDAIIKALSDPDPLARRLAIRVFMRTSATRKEERIAAMTNDPDRDVQQEVIQALDSITNAFTEVTFAGLVRSTDQAVSTAALNALANRGSTNVVPILVELAANPNAAVRESAIAKLSIYRSTNAVDVLLNAARDADPMVRTRAVRAFADIRDPRAMAELTTASSDKDKGVRLEATRALSTYYLGNNDAGNNQVRSLPATKEIPLHSQAVRDVLIASLKDKDERVRETALYALTDRGAPLPPANVLLAVLQDKEADLRCHALANLERYNDLTPIDPVRACLKDADHRVRIQAIRALGRLKDQASIDAITSAAASANLDEARTAVEALGSFGAQAIPHLSKALRNSDEHIRNRAAGALAAMKNPKADEALHAAAKEDSKRTNEATALGIHQLPAAARSPEVLVNLLARSPATHDDQRIREELVRMGRKALPVLLPLLADTNASIRLTTASILGEIGDSAVVDPLTRLLADADPELRVCAIEGLAGTGQTNAVAPAIRKAISDPDPDVREAAATALGRLIDKGSTFDLTVALQDADWHVRAAAAEGLGRIRDMSGSAALQLALTDPQWPVRRAAANALGQLKDANSVPALTNTLNDTHWSVRQSAAASLKSITGQSFGPDAKAWQEWLKKQ